MSAKCARPYSGIDPNMWTEVFQKDHEFVSFNLFRASLIFLRIPDEVPLSVGRIPVSNTSGPKTSS